MSESSGSSGRPGQSAQHSMTLQGRLGKLRHEALLLAMQGRHAEAGRLLLEQLGLELGKPAEWHPEERRLLNMAATYLQKAGDSETAARLFETLGEEERAAQSRTTRTNAQAAAEPAVEAIAEPEPGPASPPGPPPPPAGNRRSLSDLQQPTGAELVAWANQLIKEGKQAEAAEKLAAAGHHYEAGVCFLKAGDGTRALSELSLVSPRSPQYRPAARAVIRLLTRLGNCNAQLLQYLTAFVRAGPTTAGEAELLLRWGEWLGDNGHIEHARGALEAVATRYPDNSEARTRLEGLSKAQVLPTMWASGSDLASPSATRPEPPTSAATPLTQRSADLGREHHSEVRSRTESDPEIAPRSPDVRVSEIPPAHAARPVLLEAGVIFGDRFRLDAEIGRGGMALVFAARDLELDEEVALKVFSGQLVTREWIEDAVARFREELKVCRKLRHPNIIQVYDIGIHGGHRYFTMELLRGQSLHSLLGEPLPLASAVSYLIQACNGLHAAHAHGVVHRDVKPENIFITHEGVVKIMDFGIAKSSQSRGQTAVGTLAGTPEYMAPEQITGFSSVGPAADQYALGIVAYQMLTGNVPFEHEEIMPLLMMQREQAPTPLRQVNPAVPESVEGIVMRMLAKDPNHRFESCAAVARHLAGSF